MANLLTPIVLNFPDRGSCAVDYIDYFDEGQYGPDKAFFVGRFQKLDEIATQMNACLALQNTPGSMIHVNRTNIPDKWMDPMTSYSDPFPRRAQYKIRFLLRIKFYGDYAYIDLGAKWSPDDDLTQEIKVYALPPNENGETNPDNDLKVVNKCWISERDANFFLKQLFLNGLKFDGSTTYDATTASVRALTEEEMAALAEEKAVASANYIADDESFFVDADGKPITL